AHDARTRARELHACAHAAKTRAQESLERTHRAPKRPRMPDAQAFRVLACAYERAAPAHRPDARTPRSRTRTRGKDRKDLERAPFRFFPILSNRSTRARSLTQKTPRNFAS